MEQKGLFRWHTAIGYAAGTSLFLVVFFSIQAYTDRTGNKEPETALPVNRVFEVPNELTFAGESVPVDNFDTRESLDRELLVNGYWQSRTLMLMKKSKRFFAVIDPILESHGVPGDFKYMAMAESGFENATSPAGAVGVWQLLESTARDYGLEVNEWVDERYNLEKSTEAACRYLKESYAVFGNWTMAAATYNAGRKGLDNQVSRQKTAQYYDLLLNEETARYVFRLIAHKLICENPSHYGFSLSEADYYPTIGTRKVIIDSSIPDLAAFALEQGTNYKILKQLNPWLRKNDLPLKPGKTYTVRIPEPGGRLLKEKKE